MTEYHEVKSIVKPPDDPKFYIKIMDLINSIHSKEPPILEINETPDLFGDIVMPGQSQIMAKQPELSTTDLMEALKTGLFSMLELSFEPLVRYLNKWSQNLVKWIVEHNLEIRKNIVGLRDNLSTGMNEIQSTAKSTVTNNLYDLDAYIDDKLEEMDTDQEKIKDSIDTLQTEILEKLKNTFAEKVNALIEPKLQKIGQFVNSISELNQKHTSQIEDLQTQQTSLEMILTNIKNLESASLEKLKSNQEKISGALKEKIEGVASNIRELNKIFKDNVADFDTAISILGNTKNTLQDKIKNLETKTNPPGGA